MNTQSVKYFWLFFSILFGILIGISGYTFIYARGYSYMLDDPKACVNCHVMRDNYNAWIISSHRNVECNGCHTPHNFVMKYLVKAQNGFNHSWEFTMGAPDVIRIESGSSEVVEQNCIRCHQEMISGVFIQTHADRKKCFDCHKGVGHKD